MSHEGAIWRLANPRIHGLGHPVAKLDDSSFGRYLRSIAYFFGTSIAAGECACPATAPVKRPFARFFIFANQRRSHIFLCLGQHPRSRTSPATASPSRITQSAGASRSRPLGRAMTLKFPAGCGQFATIQNSDSASIFFSYVETLRLRPRRNAGSFSMGLRTSALCPREIARSGGEGSWASGPSASPYRSGP
jgi:hypothetical protein